MMLVSFMNMLFVYIAKFEMVTLDAMLCKSKHRLWSFVGFTRLSEVMGLYLFIAHVDLMVGYE